MSEDTPSSLETIFPLRLLTCSNARAHSLLIFTQHSEERDTNTPTWYSVWYLRRRERLRFEARGLVIVKDSVDSPAVLLRVGQEEVGEIQELHLKKKRLNVDVNTPSGWWRVKCQPRAARTCQALVDEVLGEVDHAKREDEFQQALLTD